MIASGSGIGGMNLQGGHVRCGQVRSFGCVAANVSVVNTNGALGAVVGVMELGCGFQTQEVVGIGVGTVVSEQFPFNFTDGDVSEVGSRVHCGLKVLLDLPIGEDIGATWLSFIVDFHHAFEVEQEVHLGFGFPWALESDSGDFLTQVSLTELARHCRGGVLVELNQNLACIEVLLVGTHDGFPSWSLDEVNEASIEPCLFGGELIDFNGGEWDVVRVQEFRQMLGSELSLGVIKPGWKHGIVTKFAVGRNVRFDCPGLASW